MNNYNIENKHCESTRNYERFKGIPFVWWCFTRKRDFLLEIVMGVKKHGMIGSPVYNSWTNMLNRCTNKNLPAYKNYGGRGIKVCIKWMTFKGFYEDMGDRPEGMTIDRINNDGDYKLSNCKWSTKREQESNTRRNVWLEYKGCRLNTKQWSIKLRINYSTFIKRLARGWSIERAINTFAKPRRKRVNGLLESI